MNNINEEILSIMEEQKEQVKINKKLVTKSQLLDNKLEIFMKEKEFSNDFTKLLNDIKNNNSELVKSTLLLESLHNRLKQVIIGEKTCE